MLSLELSWAHALEGRVVKAIRIELAISLFGARLRSASVTFAPLSGELALGCITTQPERSVSVPQGSTYARAQDEQ